MTDSVWRAVAQPEVSNGCQSQGLPEEAGWGKAQHGAHCDCFLPINPLELLASNSSKELCRLCVKAYQNTINPLCKKLIIIALHSPD